MAEKPDISTTDTVSLPPIYASSETYTESPPPAYRRPGVAAVKITKIICATLILLSFAFGFFFVTHKWVESKQCGFPHDHDHLPSRHAALVLDPPQLEPVIEKIEDEVTDQNQIIEDIEEKKLEDEELEEKLEEINKHIKLPVDLLLGNPALAGRDVKCKVQKKQQKITEGILTQAIIVTCDDENSSLESDNDPILPLGMRRINKPPMSFLGNLMKILASRPRSENENGERIPNISFNGAPFPLPGPIIRLPGSGIPHGERPFAPGMVHMFPLNKVMLRRPDQLDFPQGRHFEPMIFPPRRGPIPMPPAISRIIGSRDPRGPPIPPRIIFNQRNEENGDKPPFPFPFPNGPMPIRVIRLPQREYEQENEPMLLPPFHPIMNFLPPGGPRPRIIHLRSRGGDNEPIFSPRPADIPFKLPLPRIPIEASVRALPAPVALPDLRAMRLPLPQRGPPSFPEAKVSTRMEVQQSTQEEEDQTNVPSIPNLFHSDGNNDHEAGADEFGPPKIHSVIESEPQNFETNRRPRLFGSSSASRPISFESSDAVSTNAEEPHKHHRMILN